MEVGSTRQVGEGTAFRTVGWLVKSDLVKTPRGWVSKKKRAAGLALKQKKMGIWASKK